MAKGRTKVNLLGFPVELPDEEKVPGFHVQSPEEYVPGFRLNADGSIRDTKAPVAWLNPDIRANPFYPFDQASLGANAGTPIGDGSPSPYLAYARGLYNGLGGTPELGADAAQPSGPPSASPSSSAWSFNAPPVAEVTTAGRPFVPSPQSLREDNGQRPSPAPFNYTSNASPVFGRRPSLLSTAPISDEGVSTAEAGAAVVPDVGKALGGYGTDPNIVRVADPLNPTSRNDPIQLPAPKPDDPGAEGFNPIPSIKPRPPTSKLRKDPSPGVPVVLPDRSTLVDRQSPTGLLMVSSDIRK